MIKTEINESCTEIFTLKWGRIFDFVKHMLFFSGGVINLGIEILPTKKMQSLMSSGVAY